MSRHDDLNDLDFICGANDHSRRAFCLLIYTEIQRLNYCCDQYNKYWPGLISKIQAARINLHEISEELRKNPFWKQTTPTERAEAIKEAAKVNHHITDEQIALACLMQIVNQSMCNLIEMTTSSGLTKSLEKIFNEIDEGVVLQPRLRQLTDE